MTYKIVKTFATMMVASLLINVAVVFGEVTKPIPEPPSISQEDKVSSFLTSLNNGQGASYYDMSAGVRNETELYLMFEKRCFVVWCKDCNDFLNKDLRPMLGMVLREWKKLTGNGEIKLISKDGLHRWTFNDMLQFKHNNPFIGKRSS